MSCTTEYKEFGAFCPACGTKALAIAEVRVECKEPGNMPKLWLDPAWIILECKKCGSLMTVLDREITDPVCSLNLLGHKTKASCQGHTRMGDDGRVELDYYPYVLFDPDCEDAEKKARQRLAIAEDLRQEYPDIAFGPDSEGMSLQWTSDTGGLSATYIFKRYLNELVLRIGQDIDKEEN